jgi:hypothetical protein
MERLYIFLGGRPYAWRHTVRCGAAMLRIRRAVRAYACGIRHAKLNINVAMMQKLHNSVLVCFKNLIF